MFIVERFGLLEGFRIAHVMFAVMWMGLLWFFNVIQVPAYAEMEAGARNNAFDKLTWRALWWFRHAAWMTVASGFVMLAIGSSGDVNERVYTGDFFKSPRGGMLAAAIVLAIVMLYNVWMVIWPNQQIVIGNARAVAGGAEANPDAPVAARKAAMASRQNMIFSFTVLLAMVGQSGFFYGYEPASSGVRAVFYVIVLAFAAVMELNALGVFGAAVGKANTWMYDKHQNAIYFASGTIVFWVLFFEIFYGKLELLG